jgi:hypothetical protein
LSPKTSNKYITLLSKLQIIDGKLVKYLSFLIISEVLFCDSLSHDNSKKSFPIFINIALFSLFNNYFYPLISQTEKAGFYVYNLRHGNHRFAQQLESTSQ